MKVLFSPLIEPGGLGGHKSMAEYMTDMLFHGLRSLLGEDAVDVPRLAHLYRDYQGINSLIGYGFTLYGLLEEPKIVRDIHGKAWDVIVVTVHTSVNDFDKQKNILEHIRRLKKDLPGTPVVFVDTLDSSGFIYGDIAREASVVFKREYTGQQGIHPISYSIPKEKIVQTIPVKTQSWGTCIPNQPRSYVFAREKDYYEDYQRSYLGYTCKKGGWDCLRHYEILANGCVPFFDKLEECPEGTLCRFPKELCLRAKALCGVKGPPHAPKKAFVDGEYHGLASELLEYTKKFLTTEAMACDFLSTVQKNLK